MDQRLSGAVQARAGAGEEQGPAPPSLPWKPWQRWRLTVNDIILSSGLLEVQGIPPKGVLRPHTGTKLSASA